MPRIIDTRGTLFFEIERILKEKMESGHPARGFLLENVEGLVNHQDGETLSTILLHLKSLGYEVNHDVLDSQFFGLPQSRKRVYTVGTLDKKISLSGFEERHSNLGSVLEHGLPTVNTEFTQHLFANFTPEQVIGKSIKDKRGGENNIHAWDIRKRILGIRASQKAN